MKTLLNKFRNILSNKKEIWIENCQLKPKYNFEEEIWVERIYSDVTNTLVTVQYREIDRTDAPRFYEKIENLFTPEQIKFLLDIAENQPNYEIKISGSGTKGEIIAALERALADIKASDVSEYEVEGETLLTEINLEA